MPRNIKILKFLALSIFLSVYTVGCDRISTVVDVFKGEEKASSPKKIVESGGSQTQKQKPKGPIAANILARVGDWSISIEDFNERLKALKEVVPEYNIEDPESKKLVLDELINQQLLVMDAEKTGLTNNDDIKNAIEEFRRTLIVREVAREIAESIKVTSEDARQFYEERKNIFKQPAEYRVREIVIDSQLRASELLVRVLKGEDFAKLARENSISDSHKKGGDLGFIDREPFVEMGNAILSLEPGGVSSVFKGPKGYYIIKLEEKKGGETLTFEEVEKDIISNQTADKQQKAILDRIDVLKENTTIEINEGLLK